MSMNFNTVKVPSLLWEGRKELELLFPDTWDVNLCPMEGYRDPALKIQELREAFSQPIASRTIRKLAEGRREAVILFDDITRPTRAKEIVDLILEELALGGIGRDHVRLVAALGAHGSMNRLDFVKKLGEDIVAHYPVYNHNAFGNLEDLGFTSRGTPVKVNGEVIDCDLKIGVGLVVPHPQAGFGGGSKIVLPGISSLETIAFNHWKVGGYVSEAGSQQSSLHPSIGWSKVSGNVIRQDMDEVAQMVGLDVKVDITVNGLGETTGIFVGDFREAFMKAVEKARRIYGTRMLPEPDIVVANTYFKANEATLALSMAVENVRKGGSVVLIANAPDGQVTHYLYGKFGKRKWGYVRPPPTSLEKVGKLIIFSEYPLKDPFLPIADPEEMIWIRHWKEVLEELKNRHGERARVAIYPNADAQRPLEELKGTY
ncbi:MAG: lactate racemase domain-containing protein [Candidatus Bathyarchaeia archaeon]